MARATWAEELGEPAGIEETSNAEQGAEPCWLERVSEGSAALGEAWHAGRITWCKAQALEQGPLLARLQANPLPA